MAQWTDRTIDGWINGWKSEWTMFLSYMDAMDASKNDGFLSDFAIFTKVLWTRDQQTNKRTYPLIEMQ